MVDENGEGTPTDEAQLTEQLAMLKERGFETIEDLLADRDKTAEQRDHFKEHNEKAQKIIQRQGSELGDLRKMAGKPSTEKSESEEGGNSGSSGNEPTLEELEKTLTPEQREAAEIAFQNATDEEKEAFVANPETRKKLLIEAKRSIRSVPNSLFGSSSGGDSGSESVSADDQRIRELFNTVKSRSTFYPQGSGGGTVHATGGEAETTSGYQRPVGAGGVLEAIKRRK